MSCVKGVSVVLISWILLSQIKFVSFHHEFDKRWAQTWTSGSVYFTMLYSNKFLKAAIGSVLLKKVFLKISQNSQENNCARISFLIKLHALACNFIKKATLSKMLSCEFWGIFKNILLQSTFGWLLRNIFHFLIWEVTHSMIHAIIQMGIPQKHCQIKICKERPFSFIKM